MSKKLKKTSRKEEEEKERKKGSQRASESLNRGLKGQETLRTIWEALKSFLRVAERASLGLEDG